MILNKRIKSIIIISIISAIVVCGYYLVSYLLKDNSLSSYYDYKMEVTALVGNNLMPLDNIALTWNVDDASIDTIDENGVIKCLSQGEVSFVCESVNEKDKVIININVYDKILFFLFTKAKYCVIMTWFLIL